MRCSTQFTRWLRMPEPEPISTMSFWGYHTPLKMFLPWIALVKNAEDETLLGWIFLQLGLSQKEVPLSNMDKKCLPYFFSFFLWFLNCASIFAKPLEVANLMYISERFVQRIPNRLGSSLRLRIGMMIWRMLLRCWCSQRLLHMCSLSQW